MGREFTVKIRARPRPEQLLFCLGRGTVYFHCSPNRVASLRQRRLFSRSFSSHPFLLFYLQSPNRRLEEGRSPGTSATPSTLRTRPTRSDYARGLDTIRFSRSFERINGGYGIGNEIRLAKRNAKILAEKNRGGRRRGKFEYRQRSMGV